MINDNGSVPMGEFENEFPLRFPSEEISVDSGLPPHQPMGNVLCPSNPLYGFLHQTNGALNGIINIYDITASLMHPPTFK